MVRSGSGDGGSICRKGIARGVKHDGAVREGQVREFSVVFFHTPAIDVAGRVVYHVPFPPIPALISPGKKRAGSKVRPVALHKLLTLCLPRGPLAEFTLPPSRLLGAWLQAFEVEVPGLPAQPRRRQPAPLVGGSPRGPTNVTQSQIVCTVRKKVFRVCSASRHGFCLGPATRSEVASSGTPSLPPCPPHTEVLHPGVVGGQNVGMEWLKVWEGVCGRGRGDEVKGCCIMSCSS